MVFADGVEFFRYNDGSVEKIRLEEVARSPAYLLAYKKRKSEPSAALRSTAACTSSDSAGGSEHLSAAAIGPAREAHAPEGMPASIPPPENASPVAHAPAASAERPPAPTPESVAPAADCKTSPQPPSRQKAEASDVGRRSDAAEPFRGAASASGPTATPVSVPVRRETARTVPVTQPKPVPVAVPAPAAPESRSQPPPPPAPAPRPMPAAKAKTTRPAAAPRDRTREPRAREPAVRNPVEFAPEDFPTLGSKPAPTAAASGPVPAPAVKLGGQGVNESPDNAPRVGQRGKKGRSKGANAVDPKAAHVASTVLLSDLLQAAKKGGQKTRNLAQPLTELAPEPTPTVVQSRALPRSLSGAESVAPVSPKKGPAAAALGPAVPKASTPELAAGLAAPGGMEANSELPPLGAASGVLTDTPAPTLSQAPASKGTKTEIPQSAPAGRASRRRARRSAASAAPGAELTKDRTSDIAEDGPESMAEVVTDQKPVVNKKAVKREAEKVKLAQQAEARLNKKLARAAAEAAEREAAVLGRAAEVPVTEIAIGQIETEVEQQLPENMNADPEAPFIETVPLPGKNFRHILRQKS